MDHLDTLNRKILELEVERTKIREELRKETQKLVREVLDEAESRYKEKENAHTM